jgi:hypothetical protein
MVLTDVSVGEGHLILEVPPEVDRRVSEGPNGGRD